MIRMKDVVYDFIRRGWTPVVSYKGITYLTPDVEHGDLVRGFAPALLKHHDVPIVVGVLGLLDSHCLSTTVPPRRLSDILLVSGHSANFCSLREPPIYEPSRVDQWISQIENVLREMPGSFSQLDEYIEKNTLVDGFPIARLIARLQ